jgi:hypothetical protein
MPFEQSRDNLSGVDQAFCYYWTLLMNTKNYYLKETNDHIAVWEGEKQQRTH